MKKATLRGIFTTANSKRKATLARARECAVLSKPWYLPPDGFNSDQDLPQNFQSIGANGTSTIASKLLLSLYPVSLPWFAQTVASKFRFDPNIDPAEIQANQQKLFLQDLLLQSLLESVGVHDQDVERRVAGFRTSKLRSINMFVITGDSLERMNDDYSLTVFARPSYVTKRDTEGRVLWHCTCESKEYNELTPDQKMQARLKADDFYDKEDACVELYTLCKWQPLSKVWEITQEINEVEVNNSEETVSQFISTAFELAPGEDYGRGLVEHNWGDLNSLDEARERLMDWAGLCSKAHPMLDENSNMREEDFGKKTGTVLRGRVRNGVWEDGTFMKVDKLNDLSFVAGFADKLEANLGKRFLSETGSVRDSERTTAFEISETTLKELEGATGGMHAPIADMQQVPTFRRARWQARRDKLVPPIPAGAAEIQILTGIAALTKARQANALLEWVDVVSKLGPKALERVDVEVVASVLARYKNIYEAGLIKTDEQLKKEQDAAIAAQTKLAANQQVISSAGAIAEQALTAAAVPQT